MDLKMLIARMEPYDYQEKEDFVKLLKEFPKLKTSLSLELQSNKDWVQQAETGEVKFIINDNRHKVPQKFWKEPYVVLNFIKSVPVVSLNV